MTSSHLESKILDLQARLKAENEANRNDSFSRDGPNPFPGSRPGSGRRPKMLGDMGTPTRTRKHQIDLPGQYAEQPSTDPKEVDSKIKEIMKLTGIICISQQKYPTDISDLEHLGELGNGTCGHVVKMLHKPSQSVIAVKQMRRSGNLEENKRITMDLEVVLKSHDCDYIVRCLGCFITDADVWICMELMATCFDKLLKRLASPIPEDILGKVALATVRALHYLKESHGVIHRDVKPSNILLDEKGNVKLCDFGISGRLVDSKAKTKNAGCAAYMAPERINPPNPVKPDYDIRADVWSLGITLVELATGFFPYPDCKSDFEVLSRVIQDDPPSLPNNNFSMEFQNFVKRCLAKDYQQRPKYKELLDHPFLRRYETKYVDVASWFAQATQTSRHNSSSCLPRKRSILFRSLSDKTKSAEACSGVVEHTQNLSQKRDGKQLPSSQNKTECEGFKGVWNTILKSPLFSRRKKPVENPPPPPLQQRPIYTPTPGNISPLVLQRFIHQQIQHINGLHRTHRSTSVSPTRGYTESKGFEEKLWTDMKGLRVGARNNPSPSPEPPPRINKMVSPLLMRRIAYNNLPPSEIPQNALFNQPSFLPRSRFGSGMPPQPPPRRKSNESHSVPCSPVPYHRIPVSSPHTLWHHCDMFNRTQ